MTEIPEQERIIKWLIDRCTQYILYSEELPTVHFLAPSYPALGPGESWIWDEFLSKSDLKFMGMFYNVRVGPGAPVSPEDPEVIKRMWKDLTRLRIDAVGLRSDELWIFEVKWRAGKTMLGQLEGYGIHILRELRPKLKVVLAGVCKEVDPNYVDIFRMKAIRIFIV